jgi:hypothetical protein
MPRTRRRPAGIIGAGLISVYDAGSGAFLAATTNAWLYNWGYLAAMSLGTRNPAYGIATVYLEYANVAAPGDTVTPPSFSRNDGVAYYASLAGDPTKDYLRLPALPPAIDVDPADLGTAVFAPGTGNRLTVLAQSAGSAGVNGKPFSIGANSTIIGAAVVASPAPADPTQDILFARGYYTTSAQVVVPPSGFRLEYALSFRLS